MASFDQSGAMDPIDKKNYRLLEIMYDCEGNSPFDIYSEDPAIIKMWKIFDEYEVIHSPLKWLVNNDYVNKYRPYVYMPEKESVDIRFNITEKGRAYVETERKNNFRAWMTDYIPLIFSFIALIISIVGLLK